MLDMGLVKANIIWALAYSAAGYMGLMIALPPGNASPIWPAAGVALAAVLFHGWKVIPGLLLGAIFTQFLSFLDSTTLESVTESVYIALVSAIGSVLQAWVGAMLINRFVGGNDPLVHDRQVLRFLFIGGPLSCLFASTIGVISLIAGDVINVNELLLTWGVWWVGDVIGVLIVTPMLIILFARPRSVWQSRTKTVVLPMMILLAMVAALFKYGEQQDLNRIAREFERQSHLFTHIFRESINRHAEVNQALKAFFDSTAVVTESQFANYAETILTDKKTVQAMEWAPRVRNREVDILLNDWPAVSRLTERKNSDLVAVESRPEYYPVRYLVPYTGNESALGFDIASNPVARDALMRARDSGRTAVTAPLHLVQDMGHRIGTVMYAPVYARQKNWPTVEQRREHLRGFVVNVFRVSDEITRIFNSFSDINLDIVVKDAGQIVYESSKQMQRHDLGNINLMETVTLPVADNAWKVSISPSAEFFRQELYWHTWWLLLGGLLFSAFTGAGLLLLVGRTLRTEDMVQLRTGELKNEISERLQVVHDKEKQNQILRTVASSAPLEEILGLIVKITETANPDMRCTILLLDEDGKYVRHSVASSMPDFYVNAIDGAEIGPRAGSCGTAMYRKERVIVENIMEDPLWDDYRDLAGKAGVMACWSEPIIGSNRQVLGSFAIYYDEPRKPTEQDLQKIQDLSQLASIAIERKQKEGQIQRLAFYDVLTDLPNRRLFQDRLEQELASSRRNDSYGALLFIDLDNFKNLNDSLGHQLGDKLLVKVATRLKKCIRDEDTAARLGGDEFVILQRDADSDMLHVTEHANILAQRIKAELNIPYNLDGYTHHISPSIGITIFSRENNDIETIMKQADTAMYSAKARGKNTISYYHPDMQRQADRRLQMEKDLRQAVNEQQFSLHYQPQYNEHLAITGAEALLRWQHPEYGMIPPADFIPVAEESKLIVIMGEWVIEQVCRQLRKWPDLDYISINISPVQLHQAGFVDKLEMTLDWFAIPGKRLMLEMTESIMISDIHNAMEKMHDIQRLGVGIAIDDFGTGYSSLVYLKTLPINQLKIDKGFIRDIDSDPDDRTIVETIISMAHHMGLKVIAEGIETEEQLLYLRQKYCNGFQGYYFNSAVPAEEFGQLLSGRRQAGGAGG